MKVHILSLKSKLTKLHIFLKQTLKNIKINAFSIHVVHLWFADIDIQFILNPHMTTTYYTSYMTKKKFNNIITTFYHKTNALQII
jgi:hypothetical protein